MPIIIDAWNLIRDGASSIDDEESESLESAHLLIESLKRFQQTHGDPIVLVFDSSNEFLGLDHKNSDKLKVVASKNADDYIKRYVSAIPERQRRNLRVVSSDSDIYYHAKDHYATPVKSGEFWGKLHASA